ncbi:MAG: site-specific DNA-methyltransferase [Hyphomonadaceae bacterium]
MARRRKSSVDIASVQPPIELRPTASLKPHPRNARVHPEKQLAALAKSISRVGIRSPIQVRGDVICAGEGRWRVAQALGLELVPVRDLSHLTDAQARQFMLEDNAIAEQARWNEELKAIEVAELSALGADFAGVIPQHELDRFLRPSFQDPDAVTPELPNTAVSQLGDVWLMEKHRLICGDATEPQTVAAVLDGNLPHLMVTDPPYGVSYDPAWRDSAHLSSRENLACGKVLNDDRADWRDAWRLFPGAVAYVWHGALHSITVARSLVECGFEIRSQIVWTKARPVISRGHYHWQHEPAFYAVKDGADDHWRFEEEHEGAIYAVKDGESARWQGGRRQSTVWDIPHARNDTGHGTQKPIECMRRPILNNSKQGDSVYDPFLGSGTTLCAAEQTGRQFFGVELDPRYVDLAALRWQSMTGAKARRARDGAALDDLLEVA